LIGFVLVVLDFAALYFQVPSELSAPNAAIAVIAVTAVTINNFAKMLRIVSVPPNF
jgi:hypothetical protein